MVSAASSPDPTALWLCQLPGMNAKLLKLLLASFDSVDAVMRASSGSLRALGVAPRLVAQIVAGPRQVAQVAAGLKGLQRLGIVPLPFAAPGYPERLQALPEPPLVVYVQGQWPLEQPLMLVLPPVEPEPKVIEQWTTIRSALDERVGFGLLASSAPPDLVTPALLGIPHGLMLARQRLPSHIWKLVTAKRCTLISASAPTAQPDPASAQAISQTLAALSDAILALLPVPDEHKDLLMTARSVSVPVFALASTPKTPVPTHTRRLRAGKSGVRMLSAALGVHLDGSAAVQQERLF
ncbi:MAG TPA: hypothetical protein VGD69_31545 [Herpetosiphonaceae bacterium]